MTDTGFVQLTVSTSHIEDRTDFRIVPRVAAIRLTPDSVVRPDSALGADEDGVDFTAMRARAITEPTDGKR